MTALKDLYRTDHLQLVRWVVNEYGLANSTFMNRHRLRREGVAQRLRLYRDDGRTEFERIVNLIFEKDDVRESRRKMIEVACEQNVTRRIVDEVASLYDRPAVRTLGNLQDTERLRELSIAIELDEVMQEAHRLTFLCNEVLLWQQRGDEDEPNELVIVTPDTFDAIPHPRKRVTPAGYLLDMAPVSISGTDVSSLPHYELWDDKYRYLISGNGNLVDERGQVTNAPLEHGLGRIPGVLWHRRKPVDRILDDRHGRDFIAAHLGVGLLSIMIMQLSKAQGERQPVLKGNLASMAKDQSMSGEGPIALPPEVEAFMLDTKTDPEHYLAVKKDKLGGVAQTYGMSYEEFTYASRASSGKEWQAKRSKLIELRNEQRRRGVLHERQTVRLVGFDTKGMRVDYQEQAIPQEAMEAVNLLREMMKLGLDSPVAFAMRLNPDLTREEAVAWMKKNLADYATLVVWARALNIRSDADASKPGRSPEENGADNGRGAAGEARDNEGEHDGGEGGGEGEQAPPLAS